MIVTILCVWPDHDATGPPPKFQGFGVRHHGLARGEMTKTNTLAKVPPKGCHGAGGVGVACHPLWIGLRPCMVMPCAIPCLPEPMPWVWLPPMVLAHECMGGVHEPRHPKFGYPEATP